ncbi:MAG TPA: cytochrome c oxidase subunit 3 [Acidocella sp.]|jgi:cytochrome o ubiquinol oxidase subunit 3|uniref:cytochrome c oxidase subunit 3 n=1 Tax=Acidocella sp. TaxID=50710 RepID=UPI002C7B8AE8|nr:cytochrome c oxidase subunit 3 [Acidocella sp.]HVE23588.1 cytochrome c oxidase subunit 3 [Acidocella sp.]
MSAEITDPELLQAGLNVAAEPREVREHAESDVLGFWVFLMSDAVIFALLFSIYGTMGNATAGGPVPQHEFKFHSAFWETALLLTSSFSYGMVSLSLKHTRHRIWPALWLGVTFCLGAGFLIMEVRDFLTLFHDGATPERSGYFSSFFVLVGTHGCHVFSGLIWIVLMGIQIAMFGLDQRTRLNLIRLGLFWHFLDIIWVVIFSVVYLGALIK